MQRASRLIPTLWTKVVAVQGTDFASWLVVYLGRRGLKYSEFSTLIGRSKNYTAGFLGGRFAPPLEDLPKWGEVLGLTPQEYALFEEEAWLAHSPPQLVKRYRAMKRKLDGASS